jgi:hypothetical protein
MCIHLAFPCHSLSGQCQTDRDGPYINNVVIADLEKTSTTTTALPPFSLSPAALHIFRMTSSRSPAFSPLSLCVSTTSGGPSEVVHILTTISTGSKAFSTLSPRLPLCSDTLSHAARFHNDVDYIHILVPLLLIIPAVVHIFKMTPSTSPAFSPPSSCVSTTSGGPSEVVHRLRTISTQIQSFLHPLPRSSPLF